MIHRLTSQFSGHSAPIILAATVMALCFGATSRLPNLHGQYVIPFLLIFIPLGLAYLLAILRHEATSPSLTLTWTFAILFRLIVLTTSPSLSDDVYRYMWDGHLLNQRVNPYAYPVNATELDPYSTPLRALVNNDWMASPYLPTAQALFGLISALAPQKVLAFQISALIFDLATGWLVMDLLRKLNLSVAGVLIYLWNPLVILEFSHGAHIDSLMIFLVMASFWLMVSAVSGEGRRNVRLWGSVLSLAAATLTKGLPILLAPLFLRRWRWRRAVVYAGAIAVALIPFAAGAGWGLSGALDGTGVFGALRIYSRYWNFNSSVYHWLEVLISGYNTPGAVPVEIAGETTILRIRLFTSTMIAVATLLAGILVWRMDSPHEGDVKRRSLRLIRLATLPVGAYLVFTHTLHPWYVTLILPFLPFLLPAPGEDKLTKRLLWPWIYLSLAIVASYYTYLNPDDLREYAWVRIVEYIPFYLLLLSGIISTSYWRYTPTSDKAAR